MNRIFCALSLLATLLSPGLVSAGPAASPVGVWLHENGRIQVAIAPCGERLCGTIVWFKNPTDKTGKPRSDEKNRDAALRSRPLMGLVVLDGLQSTGPNNWEGGRIYNPDDGETYTAQVSVQEDGRLRVRAYVGVTALGKTLTWQRVA